MIFQDQDGRTLNLKPHGTTGYYSDQMGDLYEVDRDTNIAKRRS